jgi:hypothetical protein
VTLYAVAVHDPDANVGDDAAWVEFYEADDFDHAREQAADFHRTQETDCQIGAISVVPS